MLGRLYGHPSLCHCNELMGPVRMLYLARIVLFKVSEKQVSAERGLCVWRDQYC